MPYSLSQNGDSRERRYWPLLKDAWPNYELLWRELVVPLTERPRGIQLRRGIDPLLENMCMAHYSILHHLGRAHELFESSQQGTITECYDDVFFHMSAATEMVERFLFVLTKTHRRVEGKPDPKPLPRKKVLELTKRFYDRNYEEEYDRYLDTGRPVSVRLHDVPQQLKTFLNSATHLGKLVKKLKLWRITGEIRSYRNVLAHNPLIGRLLDAEGAVYLPKQEKLDEYRLWSSVLYDKTAHSDFELASDIVTRYFGDFESCLNELWEEVIKLLRAWSRTEEYRRMLAPERKALTVVDTKTEEVTTVQEGVETSGGGMGPIRVNLSGSGDAGNSVGS